MYQDAIELWDAGGNESYLYTENWDIAKDLTKEFRRCAVYMRGSRVVAWQFRIKKTLIRPLKARFARFKKSNKEIAEKPSVENQQLTEMLKSEFASG